MRLRLALATALLTGSSPTEAAVTSTAYCLKGTMANGQTVHSGAVANNHLPLGTRVYVSRSPYGTHRFVVKDRIGHGTDLDFWVPSCATAAAWGRQAVALRVGWPQLRSRIVRIRRYAPLRGGFGWSP